MSHSGSVGEKIASLRDVVKSKYGEQGEGRVDDFVAKMVSLSKQEKLRHGMADSVRQATAKPSSKQTKGLHDKHADNLIIQQSLFHQSRSNLTNRAPYHLNPKPLNRTHGAYHKSGARLCSQFQKSNNATVRAMCDGLASMQVYGGAEYRLGDLVAGYLAHKHNGMMTQMNLTAWNATAVFCARWPKSIGCSYASHARGSWDKRALYAAVEQAARERPNLAPAPDAIVIHLRLGDVIDWKRYDCGVKLQKERSCVYDAPPHEYTEMVRKVPSHVTHAWLVGDPLYRAAAVQHNGTASMKFTQQVRKAIESRFLIHERFNQSADDDLVFMARSRYLMPARGGFGKIAAMAGIHMSNTTVYSISEREG